jgi:hypothetical protein
VLVTVPFATMMLTVLARSPDEVQAGYSLVEAGLGIQKVLIERNQISLEGDESDSSDDEGDGEAGLSGLNGGAFGQGSGVGGLGGDGGNPLAAMAAIQQQQQPVQEQSIGLDVGLDLGTMDRPASQQQSVQQPTPAGSWVDFSDSATDESEGEADFPELPAPPIQGKKAASKLPL